MSYLEKDILFPWLIDYFKFLREAAILNNCAVFYPGYRLLIE